MVDLKRSQIRLIEEAVAYPQGFGYVLDFSDRTIAEFFEDEFRIDFDGRKYRTRGSSKRNRLISFAEQEGAHIVARVLRALWERREGLITRGAGNIDPAIEEATKSGFLTLLAEIEGSSEIPSTDGIDRFARERTLDELIADIGRDHAENKPEVAIDRLHTYCMKKMAHLLSLRGVTADENDPLHARFGKYRKALLAERNLTAFTDQALKMAISLFDQFNHIRNQRSLAHDNTILDPAEARLVFDMIGALLVFIRAIEAGRYQQAKKT